LSLTLDAPKGSIQRQLRRSPVRRFARWPATAGGQPIANGFRAVVISPLRLPLLAQWESFKSG
jgi:hypothetical protein